MLQAGRITIPGLFYVPSHIFTKKTTLTNQISPSGEILLLRIPLISSRKAYTRSKEITPRGVISLLLRVALFDNLCCNVWWYFLVSIELHRASGTTLGHAP